jgi:hypothetical protein
MHHSIEARSPFQSEKLIGAALKVMSVNDFKLLDKKILIDLYPNLKNFPILPVKRGFLSPLGHWLRNNPNLIFNSLNYLEKNFNFNRKELKKLSMSPWERDYKATRFLWNLIVLAQWHELNSYN